MSGHSKWATIKRKKEKTDSQRGKLFTKIGREIAIAVREGGSDPQNNAKLRDVIAKAKANNLPNENITRSIKKAAGEGSNVNYEEITYEGYAPGGIAVIVDVVTDNRNRAAAEIRHIFDKCGGSLGAMGCVGWMFERKGVIAIERVSGADEDELMLLSLEAGADDFVALDDAFEIYTSPSEFSAVREALEAKDLAFISAEVQMLPQNTVDADASTLETLEKLLDRLEDNDDVQSVYHNANMPDEEE